MDELTPDANVSGDGTYDRWGLECRLYNAKLECHVPNGFQASAAHKETISYLEQIATELSRLPHRYGYDPATSYRVLVQTWDRARLPVRSLAFGRLASGHERVSLIPDAYYISSSGYSGLYQLALKLPSWSSRDSRVVWRGSVTGQGPFASVTDIPRIKLALASRALNDADVAITSVHETMWLFGEMLHGYLADEGLLGDFWPMHMFSRYRYAFDIDGHANAWSLLEKLILGCCVLKVESSFEQWYYDRLHPWQHYVPIAADLSNLAERVQWCRDNDEHCQWIAANGIRLAATLRLHAELPRSCLAFMKVASADFVPA